MDDPACKPDINALQELASQVELITPLEFSKYQHLLKILRDSEYGWNGKDPKDRLVIFTERIETLRFLEENLKKDLNLKDNQVEKLYGTLSDIDQNRIVENFGKEEEPIRLLIASDVASEGINLHYLSHRMIHFDIPWSLMVFQQRNGRIDRYGQEQTPMISYLFTESNNPKIKGDLRILEILTIKDEEAVKNIGDPSEFLKVYDEEQEEEITAKAIEEGQSEQQFEQTLTVEAKKKEFDPLALLMKNMDVPKGEEAETKTGVMPSLYESDYAYLKAGIEHIRKDMKTQVTYHDDLKRIELTAPRELIHRFELLPNEIIPDMDSFELSMDIATVQEEIAECRKRENAWPKIHYLWQHHPIFEWMNDKVLASFGRHEAPILTLPDVLDSNEVVFILSGLIPNRKGHPVIHRWFGVRFVNGLYEEIEEFRELVERIQLGKRPFPNRNAGVEIDELKDLLPEAIKQTRDWMSLVREDEQKKSDRQLGEHLERLAELESKQNKQIELDFMGAVLEQRKRHVKKIFDDFADWVRDTMEIEDNPYIRVVAALRGGK